MKAYVQPISSILLCSFFFFFSLADGKAADSKIDKLQHPSSLYVGQAVSFGYTIQNQGPEPGLSAVANLSIRNKASGELLFTESSAHLLFPFLPETGIFPAFTPDHVGIVEVVLELISPLPDDNPSDNFVLVELLVLPLPTVTLSQVQFENPFQRENSDLGLASLALESDHEGYYLHMTGRHSADDRWVWLIQNAYISPGISANESLDLGFSFGAMGYPSGMAVESLDFGLAFSEEPWEDLPDNLPDSFVATVGPLTFATREPYQADVTSPLVEINNPDWTGIAGPPRGAFDPIPPFDVDTVTEPSDEEGSWLRAFSQGVRQAGQGMPELDEIGQGLYFHSQQLAETNGTQKFIKATLAYLAEQQLSVSVKHQIPLFKEEIFSETTCSGYRAPSVSGLGGTFPDKPWMKEVLDELNAALLLHLGIYEEGVRTGSLYAPVEGYVEVGDHTGLFLAMDWQEDRAGGLVRTASWLGQAGDVLGLFNFQTPTQSFIVESAIAFLPDETVGTDITDPLIVCAPDRLITCADNPGPEPEDQPEVTDDCDPDPDVSFTDTPLVDDPKKMIREWKAMDDAGNFASCDQLIQINDGQAANPGCPDAGPVTSCDFGDTWVDLELDKDVHDATPEVGAEVIFVIRITNKGPAEATNVVVRDELASGYELVDNSEGYDEFTNEWTISSVPAGELVELFIAGKVLPSGIYQNQAEIMSHDQSDIDSTPGDGVDTNGNGSIADDPCDQDDADGVEVTPNRPPCTISVDAQLECNTGGTPGMAEDDRYFITATIHGEHTSGTWVADDPHSSSGEYNKLVIFGGYPVSGTGISFTITDSQFPECKTTVEIEYPQISLSCPAPAELSCEDIIVPGLSIGIATAVGPCDEFVNMESQDEVMAGNCEHEYTIHRTWTATDIYGNSASCVQEIFVEDKTPPTADCPSAWGAPFEWPIGFNTESVAANTPQNPLIDPAITGAPANVRDNCDPAPEVKYQDVIEFLGGCDLAGPVIWRVTRIWTISDDCDNTLQCSQTFDYIDTTPPVADCPPPPANPIQWSFGFNTEPVEQNTPQDPSLDPDLTGRPINVQDNCDPAPKVSYQDVIEDHGPCVVPGDLIWWVTRTWRITDACGNATECVQIFEFVDTTPPNAECPEPPATPFEWPADFNTDPVELNIPQHPSIDPENTGRPTNVWDDCSLDLVVNFQDALQFRGPCETSGQTIWQVIRTWTIWDECSNATECIQVLDFVDTTRPTMTCPRPSYITLEWRTGFPTDRVAANTPQDPSVDPDLFGRPTEIADNCDPSPSLTYQDIMDDKGPCEEAGKPLWELFRLWTVTDDCGNNTRCTQIFGLVDTTPPVLTCPNDVVLPCEEPKTEPESTGMPIATDNCDTDIEFSSEDEEEVGRCPQEKTIFRTWTATDDCGNASNCRQKISIEDTVSPILNCPGDVTVSCESYQRPEDYGDSSATDNCDSSELTIDYTVETQAGRCPQEKLVIRTWSVSDACDNSVSCRQTIRVIDDEGPEIKKVGSRLVFCYEIGSDHLDAIEDFVEVRDNCDAEPELTYMDEEIPGSCPYEYLIERTWMAVDACGNSTTLIDTLFVVDGEPPSLECPVDVKFACFADTRPEVTGFPTVEDNCDPEPLVTYSDFARNDQCPEGSVIRTWTAIDACGDTTSCFQVITVNDDEAPVLECPRPTMVAAFGSLHPDHTGWAIATDNCFTQDRPSYSDRIISEGQASPYFTSYIRTWTATDDCGNSSTCDQKIAQMHLISNLALTQESLIEPIESPYNLQGILSFEVLPNDEMTILDVLIRNPETGVSEWIIRNSLLPSAEEPYQMGHYLYFGGLGFEEGTPISEIELFFDFRTFLVTDAEDLNFENHPSVLLTPDQTTIQDHNCVTRENPSPVLPEEIFREFDLEGFDLSQTTVACFRLNMPNVDLNSRLYNPTEEEGYAGDKNACAPAAVANSLHWLETTHPNLEEKMSLREKVIDVSEKMKRSEEEGADIFDIVAAKLAYIHENLHPLHIKFQSNDVKGSDDNMFPDIDSQIKGDRNKGKNETPESGWPTWKFLKEEFKKGEDIALSYEVILRLEEPIRDTVIGRHIMTVSAVQEVGGNRRLWIVDDAEQWRPGGLRQNVEMRWVGEDGEAQEENGIPYLLTGGQLKPTRRIKSIISTSYDRDVSHGIYEILIKQYQEGTFGKTRATDKRYALEALITERIDGLVYNLGYLSDSPNEEESMRHWPLRNVLIPPVDLQDTFRFWFAPLAELQNEIGDSIGLHLSFGEQMAMDDTFSPLFRPRNVVREGRGLMPNGTTGSTDVLNSLPSLSIPGFGSDDRRAHFIADLHIGLDLDTLLHPARENYAGDWGASGPATLADALNYLSDTIAEIELEKPARQILEDLSAQMERGNNLGVERKQLIIALLGFIDDERVPIGVQFQSWGIDENLPSPNIAHGHEAVKLDRFPHWDSIINHIDKDLPVLLEFGFYDQEAERQAGFWAIARGYQEVGGAKGLWLSFDLQSDTANHLIDQYFPLGEEGENLYLLPWSNEAEAALLESAVFLSYDPSVTFDPTAVTGPKDYEFFNVFPNPASRQLTIELMPVNSGAFTLEIKDVQGKSVWSEKGEWTPGTVLRNAIDINDWPEGVYTVSFVFNHRVYSRLVVVH